MNAIFGVDLTIDKCDYDIIKIGMKYWNASDARLKRTEFRRDRDNDIRVSRISNNAKICKICRL